MIRSALVIGWPTLWLHNACPRDCAARLAHFSRCHTHYQSQVFTYTDICMASKESKALEGKQMPATFEFSSNSAAGYARQHNGNNYSSQSNTRVHGTLLMLVF